MEKLKIEELENIFGGVSREEYCESLRQIMESKKGKMKENELAGWTVGYNTHCVNH
ncbi:hypothetical protein [Prevotella sp. HUN102]|uniref:hypothetical protein n=1 Tax=Prevotella sp. HUN102 TaxID=1392486 RepID=UPI000ACBEA58|nr:hypothetical protein [Prevotella sp. HUN102]